MAKGTHVFCGRHTTQTQNDYAGAAVPECHTGHVDNSKGNAGHGDNSDGNTSHGDNNKGNRDSGIGVDAPHLSFHGTCSVADSSDVGAPVGDVLDGESPVSSSIQYLSKCKFTALSMSIGPGQSLNSNSVTSSFL
jgi:hypothetical protein